MKTLAEWMREDDPVRRDPGLSEAEASAVRRRVLAEAVAQPARRPGWRQALAVAAVLAVMVAVGVTTARRPVPAPAGPSPDSDRASAPPAERRQLQFATPGGTRIIWTFDSEFSLRETMP